MRLLDRYLLRELLIPLSYCLTGFFIFWIAFDLLSEVDDFQRLKLRFGDVVEYYAIKTPEMLVMVIPIAFLLALLYALTHHARHHEITAIRAAGVSLWRLSWPYLGVGLGLTLALFAINELWVPEATVAAERVLQRYVGAGASTALSRWERKVGFRNARENRTWVIAAFNTLDYQMINPHVVWILPDGVRRELAAERGAWSGDHWTFTNAQETVHSAPGLALTETSWQTNVLSVPEFTESPREILSAVKISKVASYKDTRRAQFSIREILDYKRLHPEDTDKMAMLDTKFHARLAGPWTCLVVVLIALPFGAASGRRNVFAGVASSIVICFAYFVLQQLALAVGVRGTITPWVAAWAPNTFFAVTGLALTWRVR